VKTAGALHNTLKAMEDKMAYLLRGMVKTYRLFLAAAGIAALTMMSCTTFQASGLQM
jgi:hypothetical protein